MGMSPADIITIITAVLATLGGKEAWSYYSKARALKTKEKLAANGGETMVRKEIQTMLEAQVKEMDVRIKQLEAEREHCKKEVAELAVKIAVLTERLSNYVVKSRGKRTE